MKKGKINNSGFTVMEMIVSTAIIAILSAVFLANYHSYGRTGSLNIAAQKLASDIRQAQSYALGLKEFDGVTPEGGWGIRINKNRDYYIFFADKDSSRKYRQDEVGTSDNEFFRQVNMEKAKIKRFEYNGNSNRNFLYIVFSPPDPTVYLNAANNENNDSLIEPEDIKEITITLEDNTGALTKEIRVNSLGLVDVAN